MNNKLNNWTALSNEEMIVIKGGNSDMDWFAEHGYNARRAFRIIRRAARRARRRRRRGC